MYRSVLLFFFVVHANPEPKSFQQEYYISRQLRDNAAPMQTGYVMSRTDNNPATYQSLGNHPSASLGETVKTHSGLSKLTMPNSDSDNYRKSLIKFTDISMMRKDSPFKMISSVGNMAFTATESIIPFTATESSMPFTKAWNEHSVKYEIAKAKSKYGLDPTMSISADKEYMKDRVTKLESYSAADSKQDIKLPEYDYNREFHIDDDDVKTLSGHTLEWWPYFLHSPYEYESMKIDSQIEKAKEKRYAKASADRVIPVHEHQEDYPHEYSPPLYGRSTITGVAENPIARDDGYISYTIKDFGSNYESDPLELSWGNAFDTNDDIQNTGKRNRRLDDHSHYNNHNSGTKAEASRAALGDSSTEKTYEKNHEFNKHESGDSKNHNHNTNRAVSENNESAFKDIVDQFGNRYGGEDHKRHSSFALKRNSDNGEKRKGFRKVYHKDEYQEENEFFDNTNNSANGEDSGSSTSHLGGSTAAIHSHAAAAAGNKANAFSEVENSKKNAFENNHKGHDAKKGLERGSHRYNDIARASADDDYTYFYH